MKQSFIFLTSVLLILFQSCSKPLDDTINISKEEALRSAEEITLLYPGRMITISDEVIKAKTKIKYNWGATDQYGFETKTFKSPNFPSWLIVIMPDFDLDTILGEEKTPHLFVNVSNGTILKKEIDGIAILEWDPDLTYNVPKDGSSFWGK